MKKSTDMIKTGFISIIGRPNVGKSTLLNSIIKKKVSIVTNKPQTTRNQIRGIYNDNNLQAVMIDTPGIHTHKHLFGKHMNKSAFKSLSGTDLVLFVVPFNEPIGENDNLILEQLKKIEEPIFLIISKMDLVNDIEVDKKILEWSNKYHFEQIIPISSEKNINIQMLIDTFKKYLPYGPLYFPRDKFTDQPESFLIKEIIREKVLKLTRQEVPHSTVITVNSIEENEKIMKIYASIIVERKSQKIIIVGKNASLVKKIGIESRKELESFFNIKIYLNLFVKVEEKWRENENKIKKLGYGNKEQY